MNLKRFISNLIHLDAIDSTNNYAANLLKETNVVNGTTILTKRQEKGRGQRGNSWISESNKNLTCSTIVFPSIKISQIFYLNIIASLAVQKTLGDLGVVAKIKWPNDIYVNDKKIAGILIESQLQGSKVKNAIIGVGLNVNQSSFPAGINATSIFIEKGIVIELTDLFNQYYAYLDFYTDLLMQSNFKVLLSRYYDSFFRYKEWHYFEDENGTFKGFIQGITENGHLIVEHAEGGKMSYDLKTIKYCF